MKRASLIAFALLWSQAAFCDDTGKALDALVQSYAGGGQFSGSVLVAKGGAMLLDKGYGLADRDANIANSPTGLPIPTFAESESAFFLTVVDCRFEFFRDAKGRVTHLVIVQGQRMTARRK